MDALQFVVAMANLVSRGKEGMGNEKTIRSWILTEIQL